MSAIGMGASLGARGVRKSSLMHPMGLSGGGSAFSPASLAGLALWLKADAGLFQDAAGTIPATADADPVGLWKDQSGNVRDVSQVTSTKRPLLKLAIQNGRNVLRWDGTDDFLTMATAISSIGDFSCMAVASKTGVDATDRILVADKTGTDYLMDWFGGLVGFQFTGVSLNGNAGNYVGSNWTLVEVNRSGSTVSFFGNGGAFGTVSNATTFAVGEISGRAGTGSLPWSGDVGEILLYTSALSAGNRVLVENYLNSRWALY